MFGFQNHLKNVPEYNVPDNLKRVQKKEKKRKINKNVPKIKLEKRKQLTKTQQKYKVKYKSIFYIYIFDALIPHKLSPRKWPSHVSLIFSVLALPFSSLNSEY